MSYFAYLKELLAPLGYYDLNSGAGAAELCAAGIVFDEIFDEILMIEREAFLLTADSYGLEFYESIVPSRPISNTDGDRREALMALLCIDGCGFTRDALNKTLRGCGINARVEESAQAMTLEVSFPGMRGIPINFGELQKRIEQILPCHLDIDYVFIYIRWMEMEWFVMWSEMEAVVADWAELERFFFEA